MRRLRAIDRRPAKQRSHRHRFARVALKREPHTEQLLAHTRTRRPSSQARKEGDPANAFLMLVIRASRRAELAFRHSTHHRVNEGRRKPMLSTQIAPQPLPRVFHSSVGIWHSSSSPSGSSASLRSGRRFGVSSPTHTVSGSQAPAALSCRSLAVRRAPGQTADTASAATACTTERPSKDSSAGAPWPNSCIRRSES
jgi:hypothetical protein